MTDMPVEELGEEVLVFMQVQDKLNKIGLLS
jgi:hypothetical protein